MLLRALLWIALVLATVWVLASFVFEIGGLLVHALLVAAFILALMWLFWRLTRAA